MKKIELLNSNISKLISEIGHTEQITISDIGLPIPKNVQRIDLALAKGIPKFIDVLKTVLSELQIEEVILASEIKEASPELLKSIKLVISKTKITFISHEDFKNKVKDSRGAIRTGEHIRYANIILVSGVTF